MPTFMNVIWNVIFIHLWMDSWAKIKSTFSWWTNLRLHLSIPGVLFLESSHSVSRMQEACFNVWWIILLMKLSISYKKYLDDIPSHSKHRVDHPLHLRTIFLHCRHYTIRLNLQKCVFCICSDRLFGFVISKQEIHIDPLKFQEIIDFHVPYTLIQSQILQGKENFLRRFIPNYT